MLRIASASLRFDGPRVAGWYPDSRVEAPPEGSVQSPRSPWRRGFLRIACFRRSCESDLPWSVTSVKRPRASRLTYEMFWRFTTLSRGPDGVLVFMPG